MNSQPDRYQPQPNALAQWLAAERQKGVDDQGGWSCPICNQAIPGATGPRCCDACRSSFLPFTASIRRNAAEISDAVSRLGIKQGRGALERVALAGHTPEARKWAEMELQAMADEDLDSIPL